MSNGPDHQVVVQLSVDLKKYAADLQRARQQSLAWAQGLEKDLSSALGKAAGGGKATGVFTQLNAAMGVSSKSATAAGIRYQALTNQINIQQRQLAILGRSLSATSAQHGIASTITAKQQIQYDRLSASLNVNKQRLDALRGSLTATQQGTQKAGASADVATKFFTAWGRGGSLAGAALSAIPYAGIAAGVLGIVGAYKLLKPAIVDTNAQLEMSSRQWTVMLGGNKDAAAGLLEQFKQLANVAPFDFGDVNSAAKYLKGAGIPAKELLGWLTDIGNVASTFGDSPAQGVESITRALAQMYTAGRVNAQDINQLTSQGIPAWQILADAIGKTVAETRKLSEAGAITSDVFLDAFRSWSQNNFAGAMEDAAQTFTGSMATISDSLQYGSAAVFQPFFELIRDGAVALSDFVRSDEFAAWASKTAAYVSLAADATRALLAVIGVDLPTAEDRAAQATARTATAHTSTAVAVSKTKERQDAYNASLADVKTRLEAAEAALGPYEDAVSDTGDTLDAAEKRFKRFADAAIEGTAAFDQAIFDAQQRGNQAKLNLLNFENGDLQDILAPMQRDIDAAADSVEGWEDRLDGANDAVEKQKDVVDGLSGAMPIYDQAVESATRAVEDHTDKLKDAEEQYKRVEDAIDAQFGALKGWNDAELLGTDKYRQALQGWDDKILDARRRLNQLELGGGSKKDIEKARDDIERLRLERERVELAQEADIDKKKRELDDEARMTKEVSFGDAKEGIDSAKAEIGRLNDMLPGAAAAVDAEKSALAGAQGSLDAATEARRLFSVQIENEQIALDKLEKARDGVRKGYDAEKSRLDDLKTAYETTRDTALKPYTDAVNVAAVAEQRLTLERGLALDALERERDLLVNPREELSPEVIIAGLKREAGAVGEATIAHRAAEQALKDRKREIVLMRREVEGLEGDLKDLAKSAGSDANSGTADTSYTAPPKKEDGIFADTKRQAEETWAGVKNAAAPVVSWFTDTAYPALNTAVDNATKANTAWRLNTEQDYAIINNVGRTFSRYWTTEVIPQWNEAVRKTREEELPQLREAYANTFGRAQTVIDNVTNWFTTEAWPKWSSTYDAMREDGLTPLEAAFKTAWGLSGAEGMWGTVSTSAAGMYEAVKTKFGLTEDDGIQGLVKAAAPTILKWVLNPYGAAYDAMQSDDGPLAKLGTAFRGWVATATVEGGAIYDAALKMGGSIVDTLKAGITAGWETFTEWWGKQLAGLISTLPEPLQRLLGGGGGGGGPKVNPAWERGGTGSGYDIDAVNRILKGTGLKGYGSTLVALAAQERIPLNYALAMIRKENSFMDPANNISIENNNPGNLKFTDTTEGYGAVRGKAASDGGYWAKFEDVTQGLEAYFKLLRDAFGDWVDEGPDGFDKIISKYAPPKSNDTTLYQQQVREWAAAYLDQILAPASTATTNPGGPLIDQLIAAMTEGGHLTQGYHTGPGWGGIDIGAAAGSDIRAVQGGEVFQKSFNDVSGNVIIVKDPKTGLKTYYGHMASQSDLEVGDIVRPGDTIGQVGSTGQATGPHIHFQAWLNDVLQNPLQLLELLVNAAYGTGAGADVPWDSAGGDGGKDYVPSATRTTDDPVAPVIADPEQMDATNAKMRDLLMLFADMQANLDPNDPRSVDMWAKRVEQAILALGQTAGDVGEELDYVTKPVGEPTPMTPGYGTNDPQVPPIIDPGLLGESTDAIQRLRDAWERFLALNGFGPDSPFASVVRDLSSMIDLGEEMHAGDPEFPITGDIATPIEDQVGRIKHVTDEGLAALERWKSGERTGGQLGVGDHMTVGDESLFGGGGAMYGIGDPIGQSLIGDPMGLGDDIRYGISDPIGESLLQTTDNVDALKDLFAPSYWVQPIEDNRITFDTMRDDIVRSYTEALDLARSRADLLHRLAAEARLDAETVKNAAGGRASGGDGGDNGGGGSPPAGNTYITNNNNNTLISNNEGKLRRQMYSNGRPQ